MALSRALSIVRRVSTAALFLGIVAGLAIGLGAATAGPAAAASGVGLTATVNQTKLDHRVRLDPGQPAHLAVRVVNNTDKPLRVRSVRLRGSVLGLRFYSAGTVLHLQVPARQPAEWTVDVDLDDLGGQATGLLPLQVELVGEDRNVIAAADGIADLRGSLLCAYGLFGLGLVAVTVTLWATTLLALARGRLPGNRWWRAVWFVWGGFGIGLVTVVTLSVLRVMAPSATAELAFVGGAGAASFLLGFLTPRPSEPEPPSPWSRRWEPDEPTGRPRDAWEPLAFGGGPA